MGQWETGQKTRRGKEKEKVTLGKASLLLQQKQVIVVILDRKSPHLA